MFWSLIHKRVGMKGETETETGNVWQTVVTIFLNVKNITIMTYNNDNDADGNACGNSCGHGDNKDNGDASGNDGDNHGEGEGEDEHEV